MRLANEPQDPEYNGLNAWAIVTVTVEPAASALAIVPNAAWQVESDVQGDPFTEVEILIPVRIGPSAFVMLDTVSEYGVENPRSEAS